MSFGRFSVRSRSLLVPQEGKKQGKPLPISAAATAYVINILSCMDTITKGSKFISEYEKEHGKLGKHRKHLSMIGTLLALRGQGIGSMLMKYTLDRVDSSNGAVVDDYHYLEKSNPKNVPLYQRHGF